MLVAAFPQLRILRIGHHGLEKLRAKGGGFRYQGTVLGSCSFFNQLKESWIHLGVPYVYRAPFFTFGIFERTELGSEVSREVLAGFAFFVFNPWGFGLDDLAAFPRRENTHTHTHRKHQERTLFVLGGGGGGGRHPIVLVQLTD